jgi:alanine-synthesizing transaminase
MFVWAKVPQEHLQGKSTIDYAMDLIKHAEVAVSPGRAFGENGEGFMRIALVENEQRLRQAVRNISRFQQEKPVRKIKAKKKA